MSHSRRRKTSLFATEVGLAGMHTFMTLWYRLPMFASGAAPAELGRMVSEKAAAAFEGAWDAQAEMLRIAGEAATGKLQFADLAGAPADIAAAGLRPAFRRVKANSKRLHRGRAR
jgi:hypothetical protein